MSAEKKEKLYCKIRDKIRVEIGKYAPGEFVGTEVSFAEKYEVSRPTVRKAVEFLIEEGALERIAGKGLAIATEKKYLEKNKKSILIVAHILKEDVNLFSKTVLGIIDYANECDYTYYIVNQYDKIKRNEILRSLNLSAYSGAIVIAYDDKYDAEMLSIFKENGLSFVLIDNPLEKGKYNYVVADDYLGGYMIGDHLGSLGHKKIMYLSITNRARTLENRLRGIRDGLESHGVSIAPKDIVTLANEQEAEGYISKRIASGNFDYTAVATCNDVAALFAYKAFNTMDVKVPQQISLTGFDGSLSSVFSPINLTTIKISGYKMGYEAAKMLVDHISKNPNNHKKIILDVALEIGESTAQVSGI